MSFKGTEFVFNYDPFLSDNWQVVKRQRAVDIIKVETVTVSHLDGNGMPCLDSYSCHGKRDNMRVYITWDE